MMDVQLYDSYGINLDKFTDIATCSSRMLSLTLSQKALVPIWIVIITLKQIPSQPFGQVSLPMVKLWHPKVHSVSVSHTLTRCDCTSWAQSLSLLLSGTSE